jgi:hypothetical protein
VHCIVICKLSKRKEVIPVILLIVDVATQVLLKDLVDSLCLAISLRVEGRGELDVHLKKLEEASPELGYKLRSSITDNVLRHSMKSKHMPEEEVCSV